AIAVMARGWGSVFTTGLTIASLVYGPMLGAFLLGVLTKRANQRGVMAGMAISLTFMLLIWFTTSIAWTWYVLTGTAICLAVGYAVSLGAPARTVASCLLAGSLLAAPHVWAQKQKQPYAAFNRELTEKEEKWVRQKLSALTLDEKIGQMMAMNATAVFMNR